MREQHANQFLIYTGHGGERVAKDPVQVLLWCLLAYGTSLTKRT